MNHLNDIYKEPTAENAVGSFLVHDTIRTTI